MSSDQEIYNALTGSGAAPVPAKKSPCGCGGSNVSLGEGGGGLAAELESALNDLGGGSGGDLFGVDDSLLDSELLFGDLQQPSLSLQDFVALAEQYPGLKITISF